MKIWKAWGDERSHVKFIVKRASTSSSRNVDSGVKSNVSEQKSIVRRNPSINNRPDDVPSVSAGAARTRRKVRRRNSTSSVGK